MEKRLEELFNNSSLTVEELRNVFNEEMESKIKIEGLDCANCALELEEEISKKGKYINEVQEIKSEYEKISKKVSSQEKKLTKAKSIYNRIQFFDFWSLAYQGDPDVRDDAPECPDYQLFRIRYWNLQ